MATVSPTLNQNQLNSIASEVGYSPSFSSVGLPSTTTSAINSTALAPVPSYSLPNYSAFTTPSTAPPAAPDFGVAQAKSDSADLMSQLNAALGEQNTQEATKQTLEATPGGVNDTNTRLQELYNIDNGYQADLSNIASQSLQGKAAQQGTATSEYGRNINLKDLNYNATIASQDVNIKRATNSVAISAAQGQLANAQQYVQKALDIQFKPLANKISYLQDFLTKNESKLNTAEQNQLKYQIDQQQKTYDEGVKAKTEVYDTLKTAATNGAPNTVLLSIQNAKTPQDALTAAGHYLQTPIKLSASEQVNATAIAQATSQLVGARGTDGYTDPNLYTKLRATSSLGPSEFDNRFAYLVNPQSYARLGLTKTNAGTGLNSYSTADQQGLVGVGIPSTELPNLQSFVSQYGVSAFFTNNPSLTPAQKDAINKVYGTSF